MEKIKETEKERKGMEKAFIEIMKLYCKQQQRLQSTRVESDI
jgi:hypothetical protein